MGDLAAAIADNERSKLPKRLKQLDDILRSKGIDLADLEAATVRKVKAWQAMHRGDDGEAVVTDLMGIELAPSWETGPAWPVVQPAAATKVTYGNRPKATNATGYRTVVVFPDPQIGFWRNLDTGVLTPMHDPTAIDCGLAIAKAARADWIINLGDYLDMAEFSSKFAVYPEFVHTTQPSLDYGHELLARQRSIVGPDGRLTLIAGNHDDRLGKAVLNNNRSAMRLRPANTPESWPVVSVPFMLRTDDVGCEYVGGYPAGAEKIADGTATQAPLYAVHERGLDIAKVAKQQRQSFIQGHKHTVAMHSETYELDGDRVDVEAWSMGCLCNLYGNVPSTKGAPDDRGDPVRRVESWQHAVGVVTVAPDGSYSVEPVRIHDGRAMFRGQEYRA